MSGFNQATVGGLSYIDLFIIFSYVVGVVLIGVYYGKYIKSASDFFLAGRALPFWAIGMSIVVSDIGGTDFLYVGGASYTYGISAANFDWMGSMPAMIIAAFIFMPYYWRAGVYTVPEFLGRRYNAAVQVIHASIWGSITLVGLAIIFFGTAKFLNIILGWNYWLGVSVTVVAVGLYTFSGGLTAVVMTDVIQMIIMFVGGLSLSALSLWEVGGWHALKDKVLAMGPQYADHFTILRPMSADNPYPWAGIVFGLGIVLAMAYFSGNQAIVQRVFGARSEWDAKGGMLFGGLLKFFVPLMVALPGLCAVVLVPGMEKGDNAVPAMIRLLLPAGIRGLTFSALVASFLSSADTSLSAASTIWTTDLYGRLHQLIKGRYPGEKHNLYVGRTFTVIFVIGAALASKQLEEQKSIYNFMQSLFSMIQGPIFAILLLGIMWKRINQWGGLAGLVLGLTCSYVLFHVDGLFPAEDPFLFVAWWSFVFSLAVTVVVSLLTPADPEEKTRGMVFGQVMRDGKIQRVLAQRVE